MDANERLRPCSSSGDPALDVPKPGSESELDESEDVVTTAGGDSISDAGDERDRDAEGAPGVPGREDERAHRENQLALTAEVSREIAGMAEPTTLSPYALRSKRIINPESLDDPVANSMRVLRAKVRQRCKSNNAVILVTAVTGHGGGSFVAFNLAVALALHEYITALVVDCHLRRPHRQSLVRSRSVKGLTDFLGNADVAEHEIILPTGIPKVRIIPAGTKRRLAGEYFGSVRMMELIQSTATRYRERFVILDAPPAIESAHTNVLTELADFAILVVPYGQATSTQVRNAADAIGADKLLGCVFNNEPLAR